MTPKDRDDERLIDVYLRYLATGEETSFWAWEELSRIIWEEDSTRAWTIIRTLIERVPPSQLAAIGAGPLEGFLGLVAGELRRGSDLLLRAVEEFAVVSEAARQALRVVYPDYRGEPRELWERLDRILGSSVHERHPLRSD